MARLFLPSIGLSFAIGFFTCLFLTSPVHAQDLIDLDGDGIPETPILPFIGDDPPIPLPPGNDDIEIPTPGFDENLRAAVIERLELREAVGCSPHITIRPLMDGLQAVFNPPTAIGGALPFFRSCVGLTKLRDNDPLSVGYRYELPTPNRLDGDEHRLWWIWALTADRAEETGQVILDDYANDPQTEFPIFVVLVGDPRHGEAYQWVAADLCDQTEGTRFCDAVDLKTGRLHPHHINIIEYENGNFNLQLESW